MNHLLDSFPILNDHLKEKVQFKQTNEKLYYDSTNHIKQELTLKPISENDKIFILDDEYGVWTPLENNLYYNLQIELLDKNILFDNKFGIASKDSVLGLAMTWFCKNTNQIKTIELKEITFESTNPHFQCNCNLFFEKGELAKQLGYKFILYLKKPGNHKMFAQNVGTILGDFGEQYINLEGNGSLFPIEIYEDATGPLWRASFQYTDIFEDLFEKENICLYFNQAHKDFPSISIENAHNLSPVLREILANFFVLFIQDILEKGIRIEDICSKNYDEENTIAKVVNYWVKYLDIDVSSSMNLAMSVRKVINLF